MIPSNPIGDLLFSHDYQKSVLQVPNINLLAQTSPPPFKLNSPSKSSKTKKDLNKKKKESSDRQN
jgi:hypothetical protein